ncbi:MAG: hypothetical protein QOE92_2633 [Chloroflexota bacterium]|jgi:hypothetical protein|nr:hypothetical protein [Chloroflexota bacterium]
MIQVEGTTTLELDEGLAEAKGSHQQLLAMLVEGNELAIEPDPWLRAGDGDRREDLETRLYQL